MSERFRIYRPGEGMNSLRELRKRLRKTLKIERNLGKLCSWAASALKTERFLRQQVSDDAALRQSELDKRLFKLFVRTPVPSVEEVESLLSAGANPNLKSDASGKTLLHFAVLKNSPALVGLILTRIDDPNVMNNDMKVPLELAIDNGYKEIEQLIRNDLKRRGLV